MRAIAEIALCLLLAAFLTVLETMLLLLTPIGFIGMPLTVLLFVAFFLAALHIVQVQ